MACPFCALGMRPPHEGQTLKAEVTDRWRRLSLIYHPDKDYSPEANSMQVFLNEAKDICNSVGTCRNVFADA